MNLLFILMVGLVVLASVAIGGILILNVERTRSGPFRQLFWEVTQFQEGTFPGQPISGKIKHLQREAQELESTPDDRVETADCLILILGIAASQGMTEEDLLAVAAAKLQRCRARKWGAPDEHGVYHHIEEAV